MSDFDPIKWSTRLDGHGLAPAVEPDQYAQWGGHGMEEVRGSNPLSSTHVMSRDIVDRCVETSLHFDLGCQWVPASRL